MKSEQIPISKAEQEKEKSPQEILKDKLANILNQMEREGLAEDAEIVKATGRRLIAAQKLFKEALAGKPKATKLEDLENPLLDQYEKQGLLPGRDLFVCGKIGEGEGGYFVTKYGPHLDVAGAKISSEYAEQIKKGKEKEKGVTTPDEYYKYAAKNILKQEPLEGKHESSFFTPQGEEIFLRELGALDHQNNQAAVENLQKLWEDKNAKLSIQQRSMAMKTAIPGLKVFRKDQTIGMNERERDLLLQFSRKALDQMIEQSAG